MPRRAQEVARYRHLCRLHTVHTFMNNISESRKDLLASTGFGAFTLICKWIRIPGEFIRWVSDNFEPEKCQIRLSKYQVLPITSQDIQRVYDLPNEGTKVNQLKCKQDSVERLRKDFKWELKVKDIYRAKVEDLERVIKSAKTDKIWCKAMILYLLGCFLCPDKNETVSLKYAFILEDLNDVSKYNWCKYVLKHLREGTKGLVYPKSDMHFVMIHYIERMGRESRYSQGSTMPTLQGWDTTKVLKNMDTIGKHFGFGAGITSGYALSPEINLESPMSLVPMEADECPLEKVPVYLEYCKYQLEAFKKCVKKLKRRVDNSDDEDDEGEESDDDYEAEEEDDADDADEEVDDEDEESEEEDDADDADEEVDDQDEESGDEKDKDEEKDDDEEVDDVVDETIQKRDEEIEMRREKRTKMKNDGKIPNVLHANAEDKQHNNKNSTPDAIVVKKQKTVDYNLPSFDLLTPTSPTQTPLDVRPEPVRQTTTDAPSINDEDKQIIIYGGPLPNNVAREVIKEDAVVVKKLTNIDYTSPRFDLVTPTSTGSPDDYEATLYIKQRKQKKRVTKPSRFLKSPYDVHVDKSNALELDKNLVTYIWSEDQSFDKCMYKCQLDDIFSLRRLELWTLQEEQCVSNLVVDTYAFLLNLKEKQENQAKIRRLVLTASCVLSIVASVSTGNFEDKRDQSEAAQQFTAKLSMFNSFMPYRRLNVCSLDYILIPTLAQKHFVTYVLNLKKKRFEYLTSLKKFRRSSSEFEHIGNKLMKEACSFISERYQAMKKVCPYKWEQFEWHDLKVPEQPDGTSCGVFTMMFLKHWHGDENEIDSFRNWNTLREAGQVLVTNQLRIDICCSLMKDKTNLLKETIQGEANKFCEELKARLLEKGGDNDRGKKRKV